LVGRGGAARPSHLDTHHTTPTRLLPGHHPLPWDLRNDASATHTNTSKALLPRFSRAWGGLQRLALPAKQGRGRTAAPPHQAARKHSRLFRAADVVVVTLLPQEVEGGGESLNVAACPQVHFRQPAAQGRRTPILPTETAGGLPQTLKQACSQVIPRSAMCVQRFDDSLSSAIHITYRISLRSSSLQ
jgi:hypothetical protein